MAARRRDKRVWFLALGIFSAVFLFSFLTQKFKSLEEPAEAASLANFDPGYIISDYQMGNYNSMSEAEIQKFLTSKNPCSNRDYGYYQRLSANNPNVKWHFSDGHFVCLSEELFGDGEVIGFGETAAHIIWQAAQDYKINPQVLIVLLQKESGLITDPIPNNVDYRTATGYGCPDTAPCSSEYFGLKNQIRKAAALFRTVLDGGWTNYPLGNNYIQYNPSASCGGSVVNIRSLATSALYRYTPYQPNAGAIAAGYGTAECGAYGNRNFYLYFEDWFGGIVSPGLISAPRNIKTTQKEDGIIVSWDEPSDVSLYGRVEYEIVLASKDKKEMMIKVDSTQRQCSFDNLENGTYIAASVKVVSSSSSNYGRVVFDYNFGEPPSAPRNILVGKHNGGIKVLWTAPISDGGLGITKYEVVVADTAKNEYKITVNGNDLEAIFYGMPLGEYFAVSVKAFNQKGSNYAREVFSIKNYAELNSEVELYDGFIDMPADDVSKKAVSWAVYNGVTDRNRYFNGESPLTRRQAMVLLWRLVGQPEVELYDGFIDMPADDVSKKAVSWAVYNGVTDKNRYFNGESPLTRRQAMVLLWRFYDLSMTF